MDILGFKHCKSKVRKKPNMRTKHLTPALPMNPKNDVNVKKSALTPALSPRRGRNGFRVRARSKR